MIEIYEILTRRFPGQKIERSAAGIINIDTGKGITEDYFVINLDVIQSKREITFMKGKDEYNDIKRSEEYENSVLILIFRNWETYRDSYEQLIQGKKVDEKRKIENIFINAKIVFSDSKKEIPLDLEMEGINYLEYSSGVAKAVIYNLTLEQIFKIYNVTGEALFEDNIRVGIKASKKNPITRKFNEVFLKEIYNSLEKKSSSQDKENSDFNDYMKEYIYSEDDFDGEDSTLINLEDFWYHHNGITFFYDDKRLNIKHQRIVLDVNRVQVINGAQTITNCFELLYSLEHKFLKKIPPEKQPYFSKKIKEIITDLKNKLTLKSVFIYSDEGNYFKEAVTIGLNTQIPIKNEDIIAASEKVQEINKILKKVRIVRQGIKCDNKTKIDVLYAIKVYWLMKGFPGKSRNYKKDDLLGDLDKLKIFLEESTDDVKTYEESVNLYAEIDEWNKELKKEIRQKELKSLCLVSDDIFEREKMKIENIIANGLFYFKSFVSSQGSINDKILEISLTDYLNEQYSVFMNEMLKISEEKSELNSNDFKKDVFYQKLIQENNALGAEKPNISSISEEELSRYYHEDIENRAKSNKNIWIKNFMTEKSIQLNNIRTITVNRENYPTESFPFASRSFMDIAEYYELNIGAKIQEHEEDVASIEKDEANFLAESEYGKSAFKEEIDKEYNLFIFNDDEKSVRYIEKFSFKEYGAFAKEVYEEILNAFEYGDTALFVKESEDKYFHVRPKAINRQDTFLFSDGNQEVKRTFWANKKTMQILIDKFLGTNK